MSEMRVSDLHLRKELTQIKKAARVLRDPGTTSSWKKSPLNSSRSAAAAALMASGASPWKSYDGVSETASRRPNGDTLKEKRVFLCNWKQQQQQRNEEEDGGDVGESEWSSGGGGGDNTSSDARNGGDSKSDSYLGGESQSRSGSMIFRCSDANLLRAGTPGMRRMKGSKKKSKRRDAHLGTRHQQKEVTKIVKAKRMGDVDGRLVAGLSRDDLVEQSDGTDDYCNSEDLRRVPAASPLLLKLKHKNWAPSSSWLLKTSSRKDDSSYTYSTPALSTSSFNRYANRNPSVIESWDSLNDVDDDVDDPLNLPGRQGCGIPCYWSRRTPKYRGGCGSCYSPSLSDTLRKGTSIFCGSRPPSCRRRSVSGSRKRRLAARSALGVLPLLNNGNGQGGSSLGTGCSDDELSTNYGELDLEALSRLDGRRWSSSCRSQDGLGVVALNDDEDDEGSPENIRSFTKKYKPLFFGDIIGQNIVVQSLINAMTRGRISPFYLFQGPRGTGKTSTARIFASALNCSGPEESRPCGYCRACTDFISGKSRDIWEVDATNKKGIDKVRYYLKNLLAGSPSTFSHYKAFIIDECHLLPSKAWLSFLKFLEEPLPRVMFIFITTDLDNIPRTVQSRCQKYLFNKIKESDIISRLNKIAAAENLDVEPDALDLIAMNADGSLRDAETMLDQLSLLGKRITTTLVNELVGVVSDEKLLELLELAMSSNTGKTVKRARELMDSGVDPIVLMSQLASLIMDIIAGSYNVSDAKYSHSFFDGHSLTEAELEKLKHALKLLSDAEKQLRVSSERSTWFTATLLQLGSAPSPDLTRSSSRRQSSQTTDDDPSSSSRDGYSYKQKLDQKSISPVTLNRESNRDANHHGYFSSRKDSSSLKLKALNNECINGTASTAMHDGIVAGSSVYRYANSDKLDDIWRLCIEKCHSKTLRQLLLVHGKLVAVSEVEGIVVAYIAFGNGNIKSRVERFLSSITNSMEIVLRRNVDIRLILLPEGEASTNSLIPIEVPDGLKLKGTILAAESNGKAICRNKVDSYSELGSQRRVSKGSFSDFDDKLKRGIRERTNCSASSVEENSQSSEFVDGDANISDGKERGQGIPMRRIESIIREQRLETAWLQTAEKGTPGSLSRLRPEKNQVLPQDEIYHHNQLEPLNSEELCSQQWKDELSHELKGLKISERKSSQKDQIGRYPMSPSLLHDSSLMGPYNKDNMGYESGSGTRGCSGLFCWNRSRKPRNRGKVKGTPVRSRRGARFLLFGDCGKVKKTENRGRR